LDCCDNISEDRPQIPKFPNSPKFPQIHDNNSGGRPPHLDIISAFIQNAINIMSTNKTLAISVFIAFAGVIGLSFYYQNLLHRNEVGNLQRKIDNLSYEIWKLNKDLLKTERELKICINDWVDVVDDDYATAFNFKTTGLFSPIFEKIPTNISLPGIKATFKYKKQTAERYQLNLPRAQKDSVGNITLLVYKYIQEQEPIFDIYCTSIMPIPDTCLTKKVEFDNNKLPIISKKGYRLYKLGDDLGYILGFRFLIDNAPDHKKRYIIVEWSGGETTYNPQALIDLIDTIDVEKPD